MYKYAVYQPSLNGNEKKYVNECLDSTWISSKGKFVNEFEKAFSGYIGVKHGTGVCNGTVAIHLALVALGLGKGDEVIVPTFTYIASANPILQVGATPVFADSRADTWQLDAEDVKAKITPKTKAIMVVHLYGHPCDMDAIMAIAKDFNLFVIEDCAEAIGSEYKGKKVGSFGDVACFSFFGNKTITCGEGGMVLTNSDYLYGRLVHFKGHHSSPNKIDRVVKIFQLYRSKMKVKLKSRIFHRSNIDKSCRMQIGWNRNIIVSQKILLFTIIIIERTGNTIV